MIIEHIVQGNTSTTLHTLTWTQSGMDITVSPGSYTQQNAEKFKSATGATITIPSPTEQTYYEIWTNPDAVVVLSRTDGQQFGNVTNPVDRLAWFTVPAGATTLDNVHIEVVKMEEVAG